MRDTLHSWRLQERAKRRWWRCQTLTQSYLYVAPCQTLLLARGANINAQTEETQETALTGLLWGLLEVAKFLIKAGPISSWAALSRPGSGDSTNVHATTTMGDTAPTYACENRDTDVDDVLLKWNMNQRGALKQSDWNTCVLLFDLEPRTSTTATGRWSLGRVLS
ncbi:hypothetical protein J4Q44_G00270340 [Coregonus suidteri]|uniref:Uncharacterized protein n=1 Tax=Coregonus suidteri TaxID=861788 RepID=A0AAN8KWX1_9TELE